MTNKLVVIINSLKVPKIKKILQYEMKFLVPNYSSLQNPWLGGYRPQIPVLSVLCSQLNLLNPPSRNKIPGYATDNGHPWQKLWTFKNCQLFTIYHFIWLSILKFVWAQKIRFFSFKFFHFAAPCTVLAVLPTALNPPSYIPEYRSSAHKVVGAQIVTFPKIKTCCKYLPFYIYQTCLNLRPGRGSHVL